MAHTSQNCNGLNIWTEKTRLKLAVELWLLPRRHLPDLMSVQHRGSTVTCIWLTGSCSMSLLMHTHGFHICNALLGHPGCIVKHASSCTRGRSGLILGKISYKEVLRHWNKLPSQGNDRLIVPGRFRKHVGVVLGNVG